MTKAQRMAAPHREDVDGLLTDKSLSITFMVVNRFERHTHAKKLEQKIV